MFPKAGSDQFASVFRNTKSAHKRPEEEEEEEGGRGQRKGREGPKGEGSMGDKSVPGSQSIFQVCSIRATQIITEPVTFLKSPFEHPNFDTQKKSPHTHFPQNIKNET